MSLMQKAVQSYEALEEIAGIVQEGKEPLAPVGHIISNVKVEVDIDRDGNYLGARSVDVKVPVPCSEKAASRTSNIAAFPLIEQAAYVTEDDAEKHEAYMKELESWEQSEGSQKLKSVYRYVSRGHVRKDIESSGIKGLEGKDSPLNDKDIISFRVNGIEENDGKVYGDRYLQDCYLRHYLETKQEETGICMVTGQETTLADKHLKGIVNYHGNAKLISANDKRNFTYRGRFRTPQDALTVGYDASQKAHNFLKWIVTNEGIPLGSRRLVCWNPDGREIPAITRPLLEQGVEKETEDPESYRRKLMKTIYGFSTSLERSSGIVIASFDAATSGRLSVTYYSEIPGDDFISRLGEWDGTCCWYSYRFGVHSPSLSQIVNCAYGTYRDSSGKFETDEKIYGTQMERLIACRAGEARFPQDTCRRLVQNASRLHLYSRPVRERLLNTACAAIRKCRKDHYREDWDMVLDKDTQDRSYQYGRLLAVLEKAERDTYRTDKDGKKEEREPNAIRLQAAFVQRPLKTSAYITTKVKAGYFHKLSVKGRAYYNKVIGEIVEKIATISDPAEDKPLGETYLMGYYLQRNELYRKRTVENTDEERGTENDEVQ